MKMGEAAWPVNERELAERVLVLLRDEQHWVKGMYWWGERRCLVGATDDAGIGTHLHIIIAFLDACRRVIGEQYPDRFLGAVPCSLPYEPVRRDVAWFNDHEDTTYEDVRRVIEKVIAHE
jgi:hypothetical protein